MCWLDSMLGELEFRPMYDSMLPGGLMVDNMMIDGLPSFPPTFEDHSNGTMLLLMIMC